MYYSLLGEVRKLVIDKLRLKFSSTDPEVQEYVYNADPNLTKLQIYDKFPDEEAYRPCIIVRSAAPASTAEYGFGQYIGIVEENVGGVITRGKKYGGKVRFRITLTVESWSEPNVQSLADVLLVCFADSGDVRGLLQKEGVVFEPETFASIGNETEKPVDTTRTIYGVSISFPVQVNWKRVVAVTGEIMDNEGTVFTPQV